MIEITFNTIFLLYLSLTMAFVLGIWTHSHYRRRNHSFFTQEQSLFICEYCHFAYLEETIKPLNRCPRCGCFNKENTYQKQKEDPELK